MDITTSDSELNSEIWEGGNKPLNASYGKLMMWFFLVSDALTFSGFIVSYGFSIDLMVKKSNKAASKLIIVSIFYLSLVQLIFIFDKYFLA